MPQYHSTIPQHPVSKSGIAMSHQLGIHLFVMSFLMSAICLIGTPDMSYKQIRAYYSTSYTTEHLGPSINIV